MSYVPATAETSINTSTHHRRWEKVPSANEAGSDFPKQYPIIVHCHLCWDWVWQRPQQFISRLSERHPILFVETIGPDPELAAPLARFRADERFPNITFLRLQFPSWRWSDGAYVDRQRRILVQDVLTGPLAGRFENPVQWFYDPMSVTSFAGQMGEVLTVYDCMDELSKFKEAPPCIIEREAELLARADVVFTGGRRLFESKSRLNANCHFYGCGVDAEHFGNARSSALQVPESLKSLRQPVLGYFGVVDERLDYGLLANLADANPEWSVVMIGPVLKVNPETLPRRSNLHWLGQQSYADLPGFCKGMSVCIMPFALDASTEYINPTKTLEYMATARPIVSTAVPDVVSNFGSVVRIARTADEFIQHCREAITNSDPEKIEGGLCMAASNSWDSIVEKLETHINEAMASRAVQSNRAVSRRKGRATGARTRVSSINVGSLNT